MLWRCGITEEIGFWQRWFTTEGLKWPEEFQSRLDPSRPLQDHVCKYLEPCGDSKLNILDVGAGPLTVLGKTWGQRVVRITAVDPLAEHYDLIMAEAGVTPIVRTRKCDAERLTSLFAEDTFDLAYSQNALDHSYAPYIAIKQMLLVVKPGCYVLLKHAPNEAENEGYSGLHQWNFDVQNGQFVIWNKKRKMLVADELGGWADVTSWFADDMVYAALRKRVEPS